MSSPSSRTFSQVCACRVLVEELLRVEGGGLLSRRNADGLVASAVRSLRQHLHELVPPLRRAMLFDELLRIPLVRRVEVHRPLEVCERPRVVPCATEVVGAAGQMPRLLLRVVDEFGALAGGAPRRVPALGLDEALLGGVPELVGLLSLCCLGVRVSGAARVVELLAQLAQALEQRAARGCVGHRRTRCRR